MVAVQSLCSRVVWLDQGRVRRVGAVRDVVSEYLATASQLETDRSWPNPLDAPGNDSIRVRGIRLVASDGAVENLTIRTPFDIIIEYWNRKPGACLNLSILIYNENNICVFNSATSDEPNWHGKAFPNGLFRSVCHIPGDLLNDCRYKMRLLFVQDSAVVLFKMDDALVFDIQDSAESRGQWFGKFPGVVRPLLEWETERLDANAKV